MPPLTPAAATLVSSGAQALVGIGQVLFSGAKKRRRELEALLDKQPQLEQSDAERNMQAIAEQMKNPSFDKQQALGDYQAQRGLVAAQRQAGMNRNSLAGIAGMVDVGNKYGIQQAANFERQKTQGINNSARLYGLLDSLASKRFEINKLRPYEAKFAYRAGQLEAANRTKQAGFAAIGGAASRVGSAAIGGLFG